MVPGAEVDGSLAQELRIHPRFALKYGIAERIGPDVVQSSKSGFAILDLSGNIKGNGEKTLDIGLWTLD